MSQFEKALFFWAEVHLYGLEVQAALPTVPFLRISFEDILASHDARVSFAQFLDLPYRSAFDGAPNQNVDQYRKQTVATIEPSRINKYAEIASLAAQFGYHTGFEESRAFHSRYRTPWSTRAKRRLRATLHACQANLQIREKQS
ncbi:hypothetical protein [Dongia deserti]|uniref:hypothetical protein n=1 Tax=Dongia deserti TaxID=2268030 RepID=UPI0013C47713|nr:hypothetical protein [Dongia deserti]